MTNTSPKTKVPSLKLALSSNSRAVADAQNNYDQSVLNVSNGMTNIMASQLPVLNALPDNWSEIQTAYTNAKADALSWTNQVYYKLQETPDDVQNYNAIISDQFIEALDQANDLIANPSNATAKKILNNDLKTILKQLNSVNVIVNSTLNSITKFGVQTLPDAVSQLNTQVNDAYQDVKLDQASINELKQQIADLNAEIAELAVEIGISSAAIAAELVVGAALIELGPADFILIGIAVAAEATVIALDAEKLEADQRKVIVLKAELGTVEQDAAALQIMGDSYDKLAASTTALNTDVGNVSSAWQAVEDDMTAAINYINDSISDASFADYQGLYDDIEAAQAEWKDVYNECSLLYVNVQGNPAQLAIGMTSDQVLEEENNNSTLDFVTYINNYPSPT